MPIHDPLREPHYRLGELIQQCRACGWAQEGHQAELAVCPRCVAPLQAPLALRFGGFTLVAVADRFLMHDATGGKVLLQGADVADVLRFMATHAIDYRRGDSPASPRAPVTVPLRDLVHTPPDHW